MDYILEIEFMIIKDTIFVVEKDLQLFCFSRQLSNITSDGVDRNWE